MISARLRAEIRRLYSVERWRKHTIARHLGIHHSTVARALLRAGLLPPGEPKRRHSILDPYVPFVRETLEEYPRLSSRQLWRMARRRGYPGCSDHFALRIKELGLRPRRTAEAFFELRTLPGEQGQVDWAHFGCRQVDGGERRLFGFLMVLSYSRRFFLRFFYDARLPSFLAGHVQAFSAFGGCVRQLLYDNLKSAVLERRGDAIRFHPRLLELADHYGFDPRPVAPGRGNEKGRVERAIRFVRGAFFPLRQELALEALNHEADIWCRGLASQRPWPQDRRRSVEQAYRHERSHLLTLPAEPFPHHERIIAKVRRTPYVRFDCNRYSIPHDRVQRSLTVLADLEGVRILDRNEVVAVHPRAWSKGAVIENAEHLDALWKLKRRARLHRNQDRLIHAVPRIEELLSELGRRQRHLSSAIDRLMRMLDEYGRRDLQIAVNEALEKGSPHPETVRLVLDRRQRERQLKPPVAIQLPDNSRVRDMVVIPHPLADYDPTNDREDDDS